MIFRVSLIILILVLIFQIIRRFGGLFDSILMRFDLLKLKSSNIWEVEPPQIKLFKNIFIISIFIIFGLLFYQSFQQYQFWSQNELSKYLLPPHQSINYFIFYIFARFFAPYLISLAATILFLISAKALNKKYQERFFEPEEPYFGAISLFLMGHPGWLVYAVSLIGFYLILLSTFYFLLSKKGERLSLYYLWLPTAIFIIIIINYWLQTLSWWNLLKI